MKMYFTKASLKNLSVEILPVIDSNGQRIGEEGNPGHKQYTIYDLAVILRQDSVCMWARQEARSSYRFELVGV